MRASGRGYFFLLARPDANYSRALVIISAILGTVLAVLPYIIRRHRGYASLALGAPSATFAATAVVSSKPQSAGSPNDGRLRRR